MDISMDLSMDIHIHGNPANVCLSQAHGLVSGEATKVTAVTGRGVGIVCCG